MASSIAVVPAIEKLEGRENFSTWSFAVQAYFEHEGLWKCITGAEEDEDKMVKARSKLVLLIKPQNYVHITTCSSALEIWKKLKDTFEDSGLCRKVTLVRQLTSTKLDNSKSMEHYVNTVVCCSQIEWCHRCYCFRRMDWDFFTRWIAGKVQSDDYGN